MLVLASLALLFLSALAAPPPTPLAKLLDSFAVATNRTHAVVTSTAATPQLYIVELATGSTRTAPLDQGVSSNPWVAIGAHGIVAIAGPAGLLVLVDPLTGATLRTVNLCEPEVLCEIVAVQQAADGAVFVATEVPAPAPAFGASSASSLEAAAETEAHAAAKPRAAYSMGRFGLIDPLTGTSQWLLVDGVSQLRGRVSSAVFATGPGDVSAVFALVELSVMRLAVGPGRAATPATVFVVPNVAGGYPKSLSLGQGRVYAVSYDGQVVSTDLTATGYYYKVAPAGPLIDLNSISIVDAERFVQVASAVGFDTRNATRGLFVGTLAASTPVVEPTPSASAAPAPSKAAHEDSLFDTHPWVEYVVVLGIIAVITAAMLFVGLASVRRSSSKRAMDPRAAPLLGEKGPRV